MSSTVTDTQTANLGQCPQRFYPAMRGLRITATMVTNRP